MLTFKTQFDIRRRTPSDIWQHLPFMHDTTCGYSEPLIIELGVRTGNSTAAFLAAVEKNGGHLWSVDINEPAVPPLWKMSYIWTMIVGDDQDTEIINRIGYETKPGADVLFIDSSHEYDHTLNELSSYVPMVKPGGMVLMHDTELSEKAEVGVKLRAPEFQHVARALDTYCQATGLEWVNRPGCCGMGVIKIPDKET